MQTQQCGTMPRHEANQAQPAVSALHTHFDVSHGMGLNAKCPGQQFERRYLYNYREHSCGPEYTVHLMVNLWRTSCHMRLHVTSKLHLRCWSRFDIIGNQAKAINQMRIGKCFLKNIFADRNLSFCFREKRFILFLFYSRSKYNSQNKKRPIS